MVISARFRDQLGIIKSAIEMVCLHYDLRSQQQVLNMFSNLFTTDFDRETVHDHHD